MVVLWLVISCRVNLFRIFGVTFFSVFSMTEFVFSRCSAVVFVEEGSKEFDESELCRIIL